MHGRIQETVSIPSTSRNLQRRYGPNFSRPTAKTDFFNRICRAPVIGSPHRQRRVRPSCMRSRRGNFLRKEVGLKIALLNDLIPLRVYSFGSPGVCSESVCQMKSRFYASAHPNSGTRAQESCRLIARIRAIGHIEQEALCAGNANIEEPLTLVDLLH
jgi:hypothetical protein